MMMGASLRFFEVELEVEGVGLEVEGTGLEDEGTGFMLEGTGFILEGVNFKLEKVSFEVCGAGFEVTGTSFMLEEVSFKLEEDSSNREGTAFELEEAGSTIRFFEEVDLTAVSAARRRFFCSFSLVSYNPIITSASMNKRGDLQGQQPHDLQWTASSASWS